MLTMTMSPPDARVTENLEQELDILKNQIQDLMVELHRRDQEISPARPVKSLLKPRDIPP